MLHLCADWRVGIDDEADGEVNGWLLEEDGEVHCGWLVQGVTRKEQEAKAKHFLLSPS